MRAPDPQRARRVLARIRIGIYIGLTALVGYYAWRYDLVRLPPEGCSPLHEFSPGTRLIIDRHGAPPRIGGAVLYVAPEGLLLGRVVEPPVGTAPESLEACTNGSAFWIVKERASCPGSDSSELGGIPAAGVEGLVAGTVPW